MSAAHIKVISCILFMNLIDQAAISWTIDGKADAYQEVAVHVQNAGHVRFA
jgi:hypothetical protein